MRPFQWFPNEILYTNILALLFLLVGSFFLLRIQNRLFLDIIRPIVDSIFEGNKLNIQELEEIRGSFLEKKKIEREKAILASKIQISRQVSHDVRSPIGAIKSAVQFFESKPMKAKKLLESAVWRIEAIVDDLNVDKVQKLNVQNRFPILKLITSIVDEKLVEYPNFKFKFDKHSIPDTLSIYGDFFLFSRVLSNILNNGIQASLFKKVIEIDVDIIQDFIVLKVVDFGTGMTEQVLENVTQPGFSFNKTGGLGLGLSHANQTIMRFGGKLEFSSKEGLGTTVKIYFQK